MFLRCITAVSVGSEVDFTSSSMSFTFDAGSGNGAEECLLVPITDDDLKEGMQMFTVSMTLDTLGLGVVSGIDSATITINDDDGNCLLYPANLKLEFYNYLGMSVMSFHCALLISL